MSEGRFDYVEYDETSCSRQNIFKSTSNMLEKQIEAYCDSPRYKALALTKLEECYMFIGKAIRDDQIKRNGSAKLQEQRNNS